MTPNERNDRLAFVIIALAFLACLYVFANLLSGVP